MNSVHKSVYWLPLSSYFGCNQFLILPASHYISNIIILWYFCCLEPLPTSFLITTVFLHNPLPFCTSFWDAWWQNNTYLIYFHWKPLPAAKKSYYQYCHIFKTIFSASPSLIYHRSFCSVHHPLHGSFCHHTTAHLCHAAFSLRYNESLKYQLLGSSLIRLTNPLLMDSSIYNRKTGRWNTERCGKELKR